MLQQFLENLEMVEGDINHIGPRLDDMFVLFVRSDAAVSND